MQKTNIYSNATIIKGTDTSQQSQELKAYELGSFFNDDLNNFQQPLQSVTQQASINSSANEQILNNNNEELLNELKSLKSQIQNIEQKVTSIEANGVSSKDLDKQVVEAIKDLKNYATFFEQATFQLESKVLKTSISIAKKIINIEVGENSSAIAKETIKNLLGKVKTASKIKIHLNPKDYIVLKSQLKLNSFIELHEDMNVTPGGVVIASDLGNFDGNIEAKVNTMLEALDNVICQ